MIVQFQKKNNLNFGGFLYSLAQMCYAGRGTTAITDRSNQRSDPSHLKSLPEKSKPMLRVDLKAKISMAQWNGMNSFLNIK